MIRPASAYPIQLMDGKPQEVSTFEAFDKLVTDSMTGAAEPRRPADRNADLSTTKTDHH